MGCRRFATEFKPEAVRKCSVKSRRAPVRSCASPANKNRGKLVGRVALLAPASVITSKRNRSQHS